MHVWSFPLIVPLDSWTQSMFYSLIRKSTVVYLSSAGGVTDVSGECGQKYTMLPCFTPTYWIV